MRRLVPLLALAALALAAGASAATPLPLPARLVVPGQFPGFGEHGTARTTIVSTPEAYAARLNLPAAEAGARVRRLRALGFAGFASETLPAASPYRGGLSWVLQVGSPAAARAALADAVHAALSAPGATVTRFAVPGVPGAVAFRLDRGAAGGDDVLFADGPFVYLVGNGWGNGAAPARPELLMAALALYRRVHGRPAA